MLYYVMIDRKNRNNKKKLENYVVIKEEVTREARAILWTVEISSSSRHYQS